MHARNFAGSTDQFQKSYTTYMSFLATPSILPHSNFSFQMTRFTLNKFSINQSAFFLTNDKNHILNMTIQCVKLTHGLLFTKSLSLTLPTMHCKSLKVELPDFLSLHPYFISIFTAVYSLPKSVPVVVFFHLTS